MIVRNDKVYPAGVDIHCDTLNAHFVTDAITLSSLVVLELGKPVVLIDAVEILHLYIALHRVLKLDVQPAAEHRSDDAIKFLTDVLADVFCLVTVVALPLNLHCGDLGFGRLFGSLRDKFVVALVDFVRRFMKNNVFGENAVDREVGISSNGRGKMCVILKCKPVVTDWAFIVLRLGHRAQNLSVDDRE